MALCQQDFLRRLPQRWSTVARIRKDAVLFHPPSGCATGRARLYGPAAVRPEALPQEERHPWQMVRVDAAGQDHPMKIKTMAPWRSPMTGPLGRRWIVVAPLGYRLRAGDKLLSRQAAYWWRTDLGLSLAEAV